MRGSCTFYCRSTLSRRSDTVQTICLASLEGKFTLQYFFYPNHTDCLLSRLIGHVQ